MKQFLYLDKDLVGSIVAQAEKGLITEISNETEELNNKTMQNRRKFTVSILFHKIIF